MAESIDQDILDEAGSDSDDNETDDDIESKMSPWKKSFNELKQLMELVPNTNDLVFKRIITEGVGLPMGNQNCRIHWKYSMFLEGEEESFDTKSSTIQRAEISLEGHQLALASMRKSEEAQFIIGYQWMFRKLGCPPRIKPKADILLVVKLVDFIETGDAHACDDLSQEDRRKFHVVREKVKQMHTKALDHCRNKRYRPAISVYQSAIRSLDFCRLTDEDEQNEQQQMWLEYHTQLANCYFKAEDWKKCCSMVNELRRRNAAHVKKNLDIQVNECVAVSHIEDDYERSIGMLKKVQLQNPNNERVNCELDKMLKKKEKYDQQNKAIWTKAFSVMDKSK